MKNKMTNRIKGFLQQESFGGMLLLLVAVIALIWANSPAAESYLWLRNEKLVGLVNDGLMTFFFLIVGLELKQHFVSGRFSHVGSFLLPLLAAIGGMLVPILIYVGLNYQDPAALNGWAIPVATDIAFALGVLQLFGNRVPIELKLFLLALAIFDDVGAILIIAIAYTSGINLLPLSAALIFFLLLCAVNYYGFQRLSIYLCLGLCLWYAILKSGIHPTIAGVLLAFTIPYHPYPHQKNKYELNTPLKELEKRLQPWVAYFIMPLFALMNAGFSLQEVSIDMLYSGVVLGITLGLFLGKQVGVFLISWLAIRLKIAHRPLGASWGSFYGVALLCGIGFTMSLFLGTLSFHNESLYLAKVRLGVMMGSIISGVCGAIILTIALSNPSSGRQD